MQGYLEWQKMYGPPIEKKFVSQFIQAGVAEDCTIEYTVNYC